MHAFSFPRYTSNSRPKLRTRFNVVIVYEDLATGRRAQKGFRFLADELGEDCQFQQSLWRFDILRDPQLKARALCDVADADLVIISLHSNLPAEFGSLLDAWLMGKGNYDSALVAVFDCADARGAATDYLANLARRQRLDFLEQTVDNHEEDRQARRLKLVWVF